MFHSVQEIEDRDYELSYNPQDRFIGFDRGDRPQYDFDDYEVIGRMTNKSGNRVVIKRYLDSEEYNFLYRVYVGDLCVYSVVNSQSAAISVARKWMEK